MHLAALDVSYDLFFLVHHITTLNDALLPAFGFYAGLNVVALIMIFFLMPGTTL
jgi:hypothetical protein